VLGLTFLAAGMSIPEAVSSVIVTNQGKDKTITNWILNLLPGFNYKMGHYYVLKTLGLNQFLAMFTRHWD